jgi:autoinducer 2-degrading protein
MLVVHVHVHVRPECVEAFQEASIENASKSVRESGIACLDVKGEMLQILSRAL